MDRITHYSIGASDGGPRLHHGSWLYCQHRDCAHAGMAIPSNPYRYDHYRCDNRVAYLTLGVVALTGILVFLVALLLS